MAARNGGGITPARAQAGASAQAEYERRSARDAERRRAGRRNTIVLIALAPFVGYALVRVGAALLDWFLDRLQSRAMSSIDPNSEPEPRERLFDSAALHTLGLCGAGLMTLVMIGVRLGRRQTTEAWRIGAEGERRTGKALALLPPGYHVLHDLRMPKSRANIDHVVVGPTGVFTVETKNYTSGVVIRRGKARSSGRSIDGVVSQAKRQADAVSKRLDVPVTPVVCVHGGGVQVEGMFQKPTVQGVRFCSGRKLLAVIVERDDVHTPEATAAMVATLERR